MAKSPAELKTMGEKGRDLVASRYTWKRSARMTLELYGWLLGRRGKPEFVVED
jgi:glycosyltransferase involved in cell wall biosynthesis